ncbi:MAG: outer membrane protein assembly factor BamE [Rhodospirillales bacterium]|nr:outer membrane protein assembly factor BamE [Rhodospirillales bacterium]
MGIKPKNMFYASVAVLALSLTACGPRVTNHGNLPDPDILADVEVGHVNKSDVTRLLGSPSSVAPFNGETWYYVSQRTETVAFFEPKVTERKVIVVRFDKRGIVNELKILDLKDARDIEMVARKTPTAGNEIGLLRQLFGNVGRFEGAKK